MDAAREWFDENRKRYEAVYLQPAKDFVSAMAEPLETISPTVQADPAVNKSIFRVNRDTRFSKDKTPYKTNTGMQFRHVMAKDVHSPGYYVHLQPRECFVGVGLWRPETKVAYEIRQAIADDPTRWKRATRSKRFTEVLEIGGDSLKRPPKGFDPEHPLIDDLKRKDFIASTKITQKMVTSEHFMEDLADIFKRATPYMRFLCEAVGVKF